MSDNNLPAQHHEATRGVKSWFNFFKSYYFQVVVVPMLASRCTFFGTMMLTYGGASLLRATDPTFVEKWFMGFGAILFIVGSALHFMLYLRRKRAQAAAI